MRWFFDHIIVSKIKEKDFLKLWIFVKIWLLLAIRRVRQDCSTRGLYRVQVQACEMASYIRVVREQNAIKIFSLLNCKISLRILLML